MLHLNYFLVQYGQILVATNKIKVIHINRTEREMGDENKTQLWLEM